VGIALSLFATAAWFGLVTKLPVLLACSIGIAVIGLIDDLISMKPASKLIAQMTVASVLLFFDYRLYWLHSITLDMLLTLVWLVGITNAFNLLDNMDGLCGGVAVIAGWRFWSICCRRARGARRHRCRDHLPVRIARCDWRISGLQHPPGVDLHGRQR